MTVTVTFTPPVQLDKAVRDEWLAALRSGKYPQTRDSLQDATGFCCLGVLCDIHRVTTNNVHEWVDADGEGRQSYEGEEEMPSSSVTAWAFGDYYIFNWNRMHQFEQHLTTLNDAGNSFEVIAKYIEDNTVGV